MYLPTAVLWSATTLIAFMLHVGCATQHIQISDSEVERMEPPTLLSEEPKHYPGLEQVVAYHEGVYSGGRPQGQIGLESLHQLGIRTIICVDGAAPNVKGATKLGMRYIHLPIKYDAPDRSRVIELVVALELGIQSGPTYIHCHHGKHRSATAVAIALIGLGLTDSKTMLTRLVVSGTSKQYEGLWHAVAHATYISEAIRKSISHDLPSSVQPIGIVESMLAAESAIANLKLIKQSDWSIPKSHPDLVLAAEAGSLSELFRHLLDDVAINKYPRVFHANLTRSWSTAQAFETIVLSDCVDNETLSAALEEVTSSCTHCHQTYRK